MGIVELTIKGMNIRLLRAAGLQPQRSGTEVFANRKWLLLTEISLEVTHTYL